MKILVIVYTLCGSPSFMTITTDKTMIYNKAVIPQGIQSLQGKQFQASKIELSEILPGMCS